jgi:hypothetical protein
MSSELALSHVRSRAAMHPILNYVKFRTNHEPNVVHGVVHSGVRRERRSAFRTEFGVFVVFFKS